MEGSRSPDEEFLHHLLGNIDPPLCADLLFNQIHWEDRGEILRTDRLSRPGMERRLERCGQVCLNIVPLLGNLIFPKKNLVLLHSLLLLLAKEFNETTKSFRSMPPLITSFHLFDFFWL